MRKSYNILAIILLISTASAAVYVTTNPESKLFFSRDRPGPDVLPVTTLFYVDGICSNSIDIGTMDTNIIELQAIHENTQAEIVDGIVYLEIECAEGLVDDDIGIKDFNWIMYEDPHGNTHYCNNDTCIERLSETNIIIIPTNETFLFVSGQVIHTNITIQFIDRAYGSYILTAYVDVPTT